MIDLTKQPTEIADELVDKFRPFASIWDCYHDVPNEEKNPEKCALTACQLMLSVCPQYENTITGTYDSITYATLLEVETILKNKIA